MKFARRFTTAGDDPFAKIQYDIRKTRLPGSPEAEVEAPVGWSQTAVDILAQKYLRRSGVPGSPTGGETSVRQVIDRVAGCWRHWGEKLGYFDSPADAEAFYAETVHMLLHQMAAPNSPQWFNTGLAWKYGITGQAQGHWYVDPADGSLKESADAFTRPQPHACFIQSVKDDLLGEGGLYELMAKEGRIFKYGSGTGTNFSAIRGEGESLAGGGRSSGLMSFLKVFDRAAGAIKSGGTTRRAAKMVCLDLDHPEIEAFIRWKSREEAKVAAMAAGARLLRESGAEARPGVPGGWTERMRGLEAQGLPPDAPPELDTGYEGEAYATVSGQNANNSVRVPDAFLAAVEQGAEWALKARTDGRIMKKIPARKLWDEIALAAWESADPGVQFSDTINAWHTCPEDGPILASNPCSEYMFLDDTACNLASLNLVRFQEANGSLRVEDFRHAVRVWTIILDISVGMAQFPSREIARNTYDYRTLGLGYANLGAFLMRAGIPYDSPRAAALTGGITALLGGEAYLASAEMARAMGPFPRFAANRSDMLKVVGNHLRAARGERDGYAGLNVPPMPLDRGECPADLAEAAASVWEAALEQGKQAGFRNAQVTVLAPTGTIGLLMDCDTTGIEPDFSLVKFKKLAGGGYLKIVNRSLPVALRQLGYGPKEIATIVEYCLGSGTLRNAPFIDPTALASIGFGPAQIDAMEAALPRCLSLADAFAPPALDAAFLSAIGVPRAAIEAGGRAILEALGFTPDQIDAADLIVCGAQTAEGAPGLAEEHYAVFACANPCGRGTRSVSPLGHLRLMAAAQPFLSGAISKTVNLPADATVAQVRDVYAMAWEMMLKAVAVYRDGSKLSQPLSSKVRHASVVARPNAAATRPAASAAVGNPGIPIKAPAPAVTHAGPAEETPFPIQRRRLPTRRGGFVQEATVSGHKLFLRTGEYPDGSLGEIFIDMYKEGAGYRGILNCFAVLASKALQYGVPLEELVDTFTFTRFEPAGPVEGHEHIKNCTSLLDFIFRVVGHHYLGQTDFLHVKPIAPGTHGAGEAKAGPIVNGDAVAARSEAAGKASPEAVPVPAGSAAPESAEGTARARDQARRAGYTGESCASCGSVRVRRNGTCIVCEDCGTTSGCS
ncbi:MAG: adenosylcobalamin-dependent ribonucleoside-diphosphate reductase [Fibrobacteres bacterium]|nr:adenosylcobalamin-dependent ribonucleoside-diphosphate reductase [Fibrobacterota bacterium]